MTVITNMVVALMIVTQGEEPVRAYPEIEVKRPESQYCLPVGNHVSDSIFNSIVLVRPSDNVETLYRKTCKTNFVYSTTIPIRALRCQCNEFGCSEMHNCTFEELLGRRISALYIEHDTPAYCERHKKLLK